MVVKFVCVIRVPVCARVSRVCPGSPRCLFPGSRKPVQSYGTGSPGVFLPVCVPACPGLPAPPGVFYSYR
jgi:hypothetical protein